MKDMAVLDRTPSTDKAEHFIEFGSNRHLQTFCGALDRNLQLMASHLRISITRTGSRIRIEGEYGRMEHALSEIERIQRAVMGGSEVTDDMIHRAPGEEPDPGKRLLITRKKPVGARTENQNDWIEKLLRNEMAFGVGPAGTGKTYIAVAAGVSLLSLGQVEKLIFSRPAVEAGEKLGFLPGDMKEKVDPYMQPIYDALNDFLPPKTLQTMLADKTIEIAPLAFMRGRTLTRAFVLLDEAQNATPTQMKMFLTRLGQGSRMAITGDPSQVDLPRGSVSGLAEAERILSGVPGIGFTRFNADDVVRHPLVGRILKAWETHPE